MSGARGRRGRHTTPFRARLATHFGTSETPLPMATRLTIVWSFSLSCTGFGSRPKLLVLYHQIYLFNTSTRYDLLQEMRDAYTGPFVSGLDLEIY